MYHGFSVSPHLHHQMPPQNFFLCVSVLLSLRGVRAFVASRKDFARMRCGTEKSVETIVSWNGEVFSLEPQKKQQKLFNIFGINLARCWQNASAGGWQFTSRELQYYLDKDTNLPLYRWDNHGPTKRSTSYMLRTTLYNS